MEKLHTKQLVLSQFLFVVLHQAAMAGALEPMAVGIESFQAPSGDGTPNTFIGTGHQIASSLLDSTTPALMLGVVSSAHVSAICQQIVNTGNLSFDANVTTTLGRSTTQSLISSQITATEGCMEASDASGTQAVMVDDSGRESALVCPSNAGSTGCAIYLTGDDITDLYNQGARRRLLAPRKLLHSCAGEAKKGAISGTITGILAVTACAAFTGPLAPFCAAGMLGASAALGAAANCAASCFPGDATVTVANGGLKQMAALGLGDKVAVRKHDGRLAYEEVYAFGHRDAFATAKFVRLTLKPINANKSDPAVESRTLELTALHFVPISSGVQAGNLMYKRAQDIIKGDKMWTQGASTSDHEALTESSFCVVTSISQIAKQGLYNPFTLGGTIIVNGVVASTHSDWFLDNIFQFFNLVHWLPSAYQLLLFPARMLYYGLGKNVYILLYQRLDTLVDISEFAGKHGGSIISTVGAASGLVATSMMSRVMAYLHTMGLSRRQGGRNS